MTKQVEFQLHYEQLMLMSSTAFMNAMHFCPGDSMHDIWMDKYLSYCVVIDMFENLCIHQGIKIYPDGLVPYEDEYERYPLTEEIICEN